MDVLSMVNEETIKEQHTGMPKQLEVKETLVGFDEEAEMIKEQLTGIPKQLQVISIVGMAGLGKTTLARKLYNDAFIVYHFYIRGWTYVSQIYNTRDLLIRILNSIVEQKDKFYTMGDAKLGEELYKCLKGNRYLIVVDDIWNIEAWNDIKRYFSNDNNGSRIMFTTRHADVAGDAKCDSPRHHLRFLNEDESWILFQKKVFLSESCPPELMEIGKKIAKKCRGLPLSIVIVAGLLAKTKKTQTWWNQVIENLSSYIVSDTEQCMNTLALSYNSLPNHLKPCFLYFGAFPEDFEVPVQKMIWLWIAEGFIHGVGQKSLEDVAEDYLMDLLDRSLVMVAKERSAGGIRSCRVHDLLHNLCLRKAKEENFMQKFCGYELVSSSSSSLLPFSEKQHRLCVHSPVFHYIFSKPSPHLCTFLWCASEQSSLPPDEESLTQRYRARPDKESLSMSLSSIFEAFKLLRVLDLSAIGILSFPSEIVELVHLRFLALNGDFTLPASISNLWNLESLIIKRWKSGSLPPNVWKMVKLRHLYVTGENNIEAAPISGGYPSILDNLQTILQLPPSRSCEDVLARTPNLRKLGFCGNFIDSQSGCFWFPDLDFLNHLETLKLLNTNSHGRRRYNLQGVKFPPNLKRLTLSNTCLEWKEMSILGMLPNLEALKLECHACIGPLWVTSDGGFCRLKFLKLFFMNIEQWSASKIQFPSLQHLVLSSCSKLKEIPFEIGDISTLQIIEVRSCSPSAENSARQMQEEQQNIGNDSLKILIHLSNLELITRNLTRTSTGLRDKNSYVCGGLEVSR